MKIALVTDAWHPQINGVVRTLSSVQRELEAAGDKMLVINPGLFRTFPCPRYPEIRLSLLPGRGVRRALDQFQPEAVHIATEGPLGLSARSFCLRRRWPFTTSYHTQFPHYLRVYSGIPRGWTYRAMRWFHGKAQRTLVPTPSVKHELDARNFTNVVVWTRGVDTSLFRLLPDSDRNLYPDERPVFLYCGRVAQEKNIDAFLNADLPGSKWVVGDGPTLPSLQRKHPNVRFCGYRKGAELAAHFAAADVFVFPSRTDTFGVVMLEAMACGLPVAAYPVTGPIDVVRQGETGILDEDLAKAARQCLSLNRQNCRTFAESMSWGRCARMFRDNLEPIAANSPGARPAPSASANAQVHHFQ